MCKRTFILLQCAEQKFKFSINVPMGKKILYPLASVTMLQYSYLSESLSDLEMPNINVFAVVF